MTALACQTHGAVEWQGHVVCAGCGAPYQMDDKDKPRFAPEVCRCGTKLMPPEGTVGGEFSAVPLCPECYLDRLVQYHQGETDRIMRKHHAPS